MDEELKAQIDKVNKLVEELKSTKNTEDMNDPLVEKKFDAMADQLGKFGEDMQKNDAEKKSMQERIDSMEATLSRKGVEGSDAKDILQETKQAFSVYMRTGDLPEGMKLNGEGGIEIRSMSTDIDPQGGYWVMPELADFIATRNFETSPIRQVARVVNGSAKSLTIDLDDDEAAANWTAEGSASSDTDTPDLGELEIFAHKLDAEPQSTPELLADAYRDVEAWLRGKVADKFSRTENTAFVTGNGISKPRGFMTLDNWTTPGTYERNKIEQIASGATATLTADGLIDLQTALKEVYQANAAFLMKRATYGAVLKLKGADNYFFDQNLLRDGQSNLTLLGKRVLFADDVAAVGADNLAVAYGDFGQGYTIYDREGLQVIRDIYTNKGKVKFYTSKRVGGDVTNYDAFKIQKVAVSV